MKLFESLQERSVAEATMCSDVLFGCSSEMTVDSRIKHEVNFLPLSKKSKKMVVIFFLSPFLLLIFMHLLLTVSQLRRKMVAAIMGVKPTLGCFRGFEVHSRHCPDLRHRNAGRATTILSHPYLSPEFIACWFSSILCKTHVHFSAISLQVFSAECVCGELGLLVVCVGVCRQCT